MKLCVVTDIFSAPAPVECISARLPDLTQVEHLSLPELSGAPDLNGPALHQHLFQQGGLETAVRALSERLSSDWFGLGYSAGGTALWQTACRYVRLRGLYCISSTRLRDEREISTPSLVFFGEEDPDIPSASWRSTIPDTCIMLPNVGHSYYQDRHAEQCHITLRQIADDMSNR
ncbi:hypothetical protein K3X41_11330 [Aliiroseovarius crassostreae]|uniref:hypothetical protein n=2 Tax=Aliiroseovarius TaxID=1658781 RepID=UPI0022048225|nr:hypothetical protein [Aliiroseovarius crassostreae]UWQ10487.1 hypothetical protein K3X41_11330 [Aliiroseovarius crassostreae]